MCSCSPSWIFFTRRSSWSPRWYPSRIRLSQAMEPQSVPYVFHLALMSIHHIHHIIETLNSLDSSINDLQILRLQDRLFSAEQHLSRVHLFLGCFPQLDHLCISSPESQLENLGIQHLVSWMDVIPSAIRQFISLILIGQGRSSYTGCCWDHCKPLRVQ